jgi:uncharacterized RDD family membrane protein YckC
MAELLVETPEGIALRYELAGPGTRTAAGLVDLLVFLVAWTVLLVAFLLAGQVDGSGASGFASGVLRSGLILLPVAYQIAFGVFLGGATPGRRLLGLRVADANGGAATPMQHVLRGIFWPLEAILLVFPVPIALILMTATERSQRLGDLVAGTVVVRDVRAPAAADPAPRKRWAELPRRRLSLALAHAAKLGARDLTLLRELLGRTNVTPAALRRLQRRAARLYLERLDLADALGASPPQPREVLLELYLFLRDARGGEPVTPPRRPLADPAPPGAEAVPDSAPAAGASPR